MRTPYFVAADQKEEMPKKTEKDLRTILSESDDRARKLFERHDQNRPDAVREHPGLPAEEKISSGNLPPGCPITFRFGGKW